MIQEELQSRIEEVANDEAFLDQLINADSIDEAQKLFAERGIELTQDEVENFAKQVSNSQGELDEESLEAVSGGLIMPVPMLGPIIFSVAAKLAKKISKLKWFR